MDIKKIVVGGVAAALLLGSSAAAAFALSGVSNGSFETGAVVDPFTTLNPGDTNINNWVVASGSVDYISTYWQAADGARSVDMNGLVAGTINQAVPTTTGALYKVTFKLSGNPDSAGVDSAYYSPSNKQLTLSATGAAPQTFSYDTSAMGNTKTDMKWAPESYSFTASGS